MTASQEYSFESKNFSLDPNTDKFYDLAIAVLEHSVEIGKGIQIAHLPEANAKCKGLDLVLSGWGSDRARPYRPLNRLWAVKQSCLNVSECKLYKGTGENVLCVGDTDKTNSACFQDSGGIKITMWLKSVMISKTN